MKKRHPDYRWDRSLRRYVRKDGLTEIILADEAGEVCRIGVIRRRVAGSPAANFLGEAGGSWCIDVALPRVAWLERKKI